MHHPSLGCFKSLQKGCLLHCLQNVVKYQLLKEMPIINFHSLPSNQHLWKAEPSTIFQPNGASQTPHLFKKTNVRGTGKPNMLCLEFKS